MTATALEALIADYLLLCPARFQRVGLIGLVRNERCELLESLRQAHADLVRLSGALSPDVLHASGIRATIARCDSLLAGA